MDRSHMKGNSLQASTRANHQLAGVGAAAACGAPSPCAARSSGAAGGRCNPCQAGLQQEDAWTGASASSAGGVSSITAGCIPATQVCSSRLRAPVQNSYPQVVKHLRLKANVLRQRPCGQVAGCLASGQACKAWSSVQAIAVHRCSWKWLLLRAALRHCVSWRPCRSVQQDGAEGGLRAPSGLRMTAEEWSWQSASSQCRGAGQACLQPLPMPLALSSRLPMLCKRRSCPKLLRAAGSLRCMCHHNSSRVPLCALQVSYALQAQELLVPRGGTGMPDNAAASLSHLVAPAADHAVAGSHAADADMPTALNDNVQALGIPADCCCLESYADHLQL